MFLISPCDTVSLYMGIIGLGTALRSLRARIGYHLKIYSESWFHESSEMSTNICNSEFQFATVNLLDLFFPKRCVGCGNVGRYFCPSCTSKVRIIKSNEAICPVCERLAVDGRTHPGCHTRYSLDGLTSFFRYEGPIRNAVKQLKYRRVSSLASEFIDLIPASSFPVIPKPHTLDPKPFSLIPIPLHSSRRRERGFNQAEVVAKFISRRLSADEAGRLNVPMRTDILRRVRKTTPQVEMKERDNRMANMKNVFSLHHSSFIIHNSAFLLIDDVFTTGATMRAAANVLKHSGAKFVWGITMAR